MKWKINSGRQSRTLVIDSCGEYISQEFKDYLKACGIVQQLTPPYTPQHNGVSERRNQSFNSILNRVLNQEVDKTPYELWIPPKRKTMGYYFYFPPGKKIVVARGRREHSLGDLNETQLAIKPPMWDSESNNVDRCYEANIQSMMDNMVWVLVDLPPGCKTIGKTFSPVADIRAIRILISIAAYYDYEIWQMDIKTCFLNGYLDEDIYMVQPKGFVDPNHSRKVWIYSILKSCVYQKASGSNVTFLILYVDDIIIMKNHIPSLQSVKDYLRKCFAMKDLGEAAFILGIKIYRDRSKHFIRLGQNAYMDKILKRYRMDNSKCGHIPMQERLDLNKTQGASTPEEVKRMQNVPYALAVGSIMYAVRCTRPDVAFTQNITSRFQQNPGECHWTAMKNILNQLHKLNYIAASESKMEVVWTRKFISGLGIVPTINEPIKMFCGNSAALLFANKMGVQKGTRHYHKRYHYVRECITLHEIRFLKVHIDDNLADPFMKALPKGKLTQHARSMGLRLASSFM
ncbi:retrotransposon protein, putative, ty1-copia subclass [Tanacetum coccineum]